VRTGSGHYKSGMSCPQNPTAGQCALGCRSVVFEPRTDKASARSGSESGAHVQAHVDVVTGGVRVRAHDVGLVHQLLQLGLVHARALDAQVDFDAKAGRDLADADVAGDGQVGRQRDLGLARDKFQRAQEAGRITGCKQLLGIGARAATAAQFLRRGQRHVQGAIRTFRRAFTAALRRGLCAIQDFFDAHLLLLM
jgi:hypothetical protein